MENFIRPKVEILPKESIIPNENLISPAPNQFTHELRKTQSYYYINTGQAFPPDGEFPKGTKVVLIRHDGGNYCYVADGRGIYAEIQFDSLKKL